MELITPINSSRFDWIPEHGTAIQTLWKEPSIQAVYERRNQFQLTDSTAYYFKHLDRIIASDYIPTQEDIIHARVQTTGIVEVPFDYGGFHFRYVIHCSFLVLLTLVANVQNEKNGSIASKE